jgi:glutathione peroxidase
MTIKQKLLKAIYPAFTAFSRLFGRNNKIINNQKTVRPLQSFYKLSVTLNDGSRLSMKTLRGKKIMLVNTASNCGYTGQYAELQKLFKQHQEKLIIIAFPANDFKEQEQNTDEAIESFCVNNFGISFPIAAKTVVVRSPKQNPVYQWLTDSSKNGWNKQQPSWNFAKYLVNEEGVLTSYFDPAISPLSSPVLKEIRD